jgi:hypothetical protein
MVEYQSTYKNARAVARAISGAGLLVTVLGFLGCLSSMLRVIGYLEQAGVMDIVPLLIALSVFLAGIVVRGIGEHLRATVDIADFTGEMLHIMKNDRKAGHEMPAAMVAGK